MSSRIHPQALTTVLALSLAIAGCGGSPPDTVNGAAEPVAGGEMTTLTEESTRDTDLGLSKTSVFDAPAPPEWAANETAPGDQEVLPRAYPGAPPVISHGVEEFLPITREDNNCLLCHLPPEEGVEPDAPSLPENHLIDLRNAPDVKRDEPAGARYVCTTCHAARNQTRPLVANSFAAP